MIRINLLFSFDQIYFGHSRIVSILKAIIVTLTCCSLLACQEADIAHDLNQRQANEIVTVLSEQGIPSEAVKGVGSRGQFIVQVPAARYSEAVAILHYEGLPKLEEPSLNDLLSPKGFLPNSRELENMRVDRAVASEIETMLKTNPAINEVKVLVRRAAFEGIGPQPPAHVSLIVRKQAEQQINKDNIYSLVANMIAGVTPDSVVIDIQDALPQASNLRQGALRSSSSGGKVINVPMKEFLGWWRVAANDYDRMILVLLIAVVCFLIIGLFVGFSVGFLGRKVLSSRPTENFTALKNDRAHLTLNSPD